MISLKTYNKHQLEKLINSNQFKEFPFCPITHHRAISHTKNPNANDSDSLLILAFENDDLAGYIGVLPDNIKLKEQNVHMGWLSTLFVHPNFRGKKIAQKLLAKACEEYNNNIMITEFTPEAENMYAKSQLFVYKNQLNGRSYHYLSNLKKILPSKNKDWSQLQLGLKVFDSSLNSLVKIKNNLQKSNKEDFKVLNNIDDEIKKFIEQNKSKNCFNRSTAEIEWITNNPWIISSSQQSKENYQFSAFEKKFEYIFIKIYHESKLDTVLILSNRNGNAKLHFIFGNKNPVSCSNVLHQYITRNNISNLITFEENINMELDKKNILVKKDRYRKFLVHKNLEKILGEDFIYDICAGDGDPIFT